VGASIGRTAHRAGFPSGRAMLPEGHIEAVTTGAIFNLADFRAEAPGVTSTAELVARLYAADALDRLAAANGQFAAAIYDRPYHRLVLITDRLCTTGIHVWRHDGEIVFATQLFTILGDPRIARRPDGAALAQLFTMQRTIGETTPVAGVTALPAACIATYDDAGEKHRPYWRLRWSVGSFSEDEGAEALAESLRRAVARQAIGRQNGLLLSGGVDSRLVLAAAGAHALSCWTTAGYDGNPELALARQTAAIFGAPHHTLLVDPADTLSVNDDTVVESSGLYPASNPMSAFLLRVGEACDVVLTGHGLDYTLRGYYLPTRFAELLDSRTRLALLAPIPSKPTGRDVFARLRQGPPRSTIRRIVRRERAEEWWRGQEIAMDRVLRPWLESDDPYNAWDAFILHSVNKHYAFTGMMASRAVADLAIPAFDNEVFGIYLGMTPTWRVSGRLVQKALRRLSPTAARLPNANTHFRADLHPWLEVAGLFSRAVLRRLGLAKRPALPSSLHSAGSWQNLNTLYREEPRHRQRFLEIRDRLDALTLGILDADGLAACIDEHLEGRAKHAKLLRQILTHDAWVRRFGIRGHV
jgi:asparagine synthase (glutamine-hydrolysing)